MSRFARILLVALVMSSVLALAPVHAASPRAAQQLVISEGLTGTQTDPVLATNPKTGDVLVVWQSNDVGSTIQSRFLKRGGDGTYSASPIRRLSNDGVFASRQPNVVWNPYKKGFVVAWVEEAFGIVGDVMLATLSKKGKPKGKAKRVLEGMYSSPRLGEGSQKGELELLTSGFEATARNYVGKTWRLRFDGKKLNAIDSAELATSGLSILKNRQEYVLENWAQLPGGDYVLFLNLHDSMGDEGETVIVRATLKNGKLVATRAASPFVRPLRNVSLVVTDGGQVGFDGSETLPTGTIDDLWGTFDPESMTLGPTDSVAIGYGFIVVHHYWTRTSRTRAEDGFVHVLLDASGSVEARLLDSTTLAVLESQTLLAGAGANITDVAGVEVLAAKPGTPNFMLARSGGAGLVVDFVELEARE